MFNIYWEIDVLGLWKGLRGNVFVICKKINLILVVFFVFVF